MQQQHLLGCASASGCVSMQCCVSWLASGSSAACPLTPSMLLNARPPQFVNEPRLYLSPVASEHTTAGVRRERGERLGASLSLPAPIPAAACRCEPLPACTLSSMPSSTEPCHPCLQLPPASSADSGIANRQIDVAVGQYVLPLMPALFEDEDPMPL